MENLGKESTNLALPKNKEDIKHAVTNIYVGLDKATAKGTFTLKEAGELSKNLELVAQILDQIMTLYDKQNNSV
jgi:hypothetical protein